MVRIFRGGPRDGLQPVAHDRELWFQSGTVVRGGFDLARHGSDTGRERLRGREVPATCQSRTRGRLWMTIREAAATDNDAIWAILQPVISAGDTYPLPRDMSRDEALAQWFAS